MSAAARLAGRASSLTAISGPMPFGSPGSTASRGRGGLRRVCGMASVDPDVRRLDQLAEAVVLGLVHLGELRARDAAGLAAEALQSRLHVGQLEDPLELRGE